VFPPRVTKRAWKESCDGPHSFKSYTFFCIDVFYVSVCNKDFHSPENKQEQYKKFKDIVPVWLKAAYFSLLIIYLIEICVWSYMQSIGANNAVESVLWCADVICLIPLLIVFIKKR
jgi:hypothetical protein